jgi:hypothetical protein
MCDFRDRIMGRHISKPSTPPPTERSTFLQDVQEGGIALQGWLALVALVIATGAAIFWKSLIVGVLGWVALYLGFSLAYTLLARIFGWRRLRWMAFFGHVIDFLNFLSSL